MIKKLSLIVFRLNDVFCINTYDKITDKKNMVNNKIW